MKTQFALISLIFLSASAFAREDYTVHCRSLKACTADYNPTACVYKNEIKAEGSNKCDAVSKIESELCTEAGTEKIILDSEDFHCQGEVPRSYRGCTHAPWGPHC